MYMFCCRFMLECRQKWINAEHVTLEADLQLNLQVAITSRPIKNVRVRSIMQCPTSVSIALATAEAFCSFTLVSMCWDGTNIWISFEHSSTSAVLTSRLQPTPDGWKQRVSRRCHKGDHNFWCGDISGQWKAALTSHKSLKNKYSHWQRFRHT